MGFDGFFVAVASLIASDGEAEGSEGGVCGHFVYSCGVVVG